MSFEPIIEEADHFDACIKVIGVGGGGGNAVEHMIENHATGITFIAANTDKQALSRSRADIVIPLGKTGLGAGAKPEVGAMAAQEATDKIREALEGTHLLFITAGMGGGTGTGAAPVIAEIAKELGILTVAVVTKPFEFEGTRRMRQAQAGIENLKDKVDSLIVILNDKLEDEVGGAATMVDCFAAADDVLYKACNGIAEIIHTPGIINVDFEDLRTVMSERGTAMMGTATAAGPDRAREAAEKAIACPLLEGANLQGARGLLVYVTASSDTMSQPEIRQVMAVMKNFVSRDAQTIIGTAFDDSMNDALRVTVVATGLDDPHEPGQQPQQVPGLQAGLYQPPQRATTFVSAPVFTSQPLQQPAYPHPQAAAPQAPAFAQPQAPVYAQPVQQAAQPVAQPQMQPQPAMAPQHLQPAPQPQQPLDPYGRATAPKAEDAKAAPFVAVPTFLRGTR